MSTLALTDPLLGLGCAEAIVGVITAVSCSMIYRYSSVKLAMTPRHHCRITAGHGAI